MVGHAGISRRCRRRRRINAEGAKVSEVAEKVWRPSAVARSGTILSYCLAWILACLRYGWLVKECSRLGVWVFQPGQDYDDCILICKQTVIEQTLVQV